MKIGHFPYSPGGNPYQQLFSSSLENAGLEVLRIPPRKWFPLQYACSHEIDLLQLDWPHAWYSGRNFLSQALKRAIYLEGLKALKKTPCVWTAHNLSAHDSKNYRYEKKMIQKLIDVCDGVIVMSRISHDLLLNTYRLSDSTKIKIIPHGHYIDVYPNNVSKREARLKLAINPESRVVLSPGRILPYKGTSELVESFCRIARGGDVLIIAGPAPASESIEHLNRTILENCARDVVVKIIPKFIHENEFQYYFNASDVVALPFKNILNSGSLLLAMSFGKCVIAPRIGSIPEIAYPGGWFAYDPDDEYGLEKSLLEAMECDDIRQREQKVLRYTKENYGWPEVASKAKSFYENILS